MDDLLCIKKDINSKFICVKLDNPPFNAELRIVGIVRVGIEK